MRYNRRWALSLSLGLSIYSFIVWLWVGINYYVYPRYQFEGISAYIPIPQDLLADVAFPVSFLSFVLWYYLKQEPQDEPDERRP